VVTLLPPEWKPTGRAAVIIGVIGGIALVNIGGVKHGTRLINAATALKLIPLAIFLVPERARCTLRILSTVQPTSAGMGEQ